VQTSLRKILIDSQVAAVAIAVLIFYSALEAVFALWEPVNQIVSYLITAVAIRDIPSFTATRSYATSSMLPITFVILLLALANLAAAWLLSRWVYGVGPLRSLGNLRNKLLRKKHA
jgi:small-conductance mechanosensitive channel